MLALFILTGFAGAHLTQVEAGAAEDRIRVTSQSKFSTLKRPPSFTPLQMLELGAAAEAKGDNQTAALIYDALKNDPDRGIRSEARFRRAKQFIAAKRLSAAALLLRSILDENPDAVPVRLQLAAVLHQMGDQIGALAELRSAQASHLPVTLARLIDRFSEAIRAERSSGVSFEVALAPDSNINRATRSDALGTVLGDFVIDKASKARSGIGLSLQGAVFRRFPLTNSAVHVLLRGTGSADLYRAKQFNNIAVDVSGGPEIQLGAVRLNAEIGFTQRWFGQRPFLTAEHATLSGFRPVGRRSQLLLSTTVTHIQNDLTPLQTGTDYSIESSLDHALSPRMGLIVSGGAERQTARNSVFASKGWNAGLTLWRDIGRTTVALSGTLRHLNADARLLLFPRIRADAFASVAIAATFRQLQVHDFAPVVRISFERNRSSVSIYDYRRRHVEIGLARAF